MQGYEYFKPIDGSIASGASMGAVAPIFGASIVNIRVATCASAHVYNILVSDNDTTSTFLPLMAMGADGTNAGFGVMSLPSSVGGFLWNLGDSGAGQKFMRVESDATCDSGHEITIYNIR